MYDLFQRKTTTLEFAILGLVNKAPLSGYQLRQEFETTALGNYSSSPGAIYPALKRLQDSGFVEQIYPNGSKKQKYKCTADGKKVLKGWFLKEIERKDISHNLDVLLLRFAFMDNMVSDNQKVNFLKSLGARIEEYLEDLTQYHNSLVFKEQPLTGQLAFKHGLESYATTLKWSQDCIKTLNKKTA